MKRTGIFADSGQTGTLHESLQTRLQAVTHGPERLVVVLHAQKLCGEPLADLQKT